MYLCTLHIHKYTSKTFIEDDEDPNLPKPLVSIQVASPEDEDDLEVANTLGHR